MIDDTQQAPQHDKKRILKKVRHNFLRRRAEEDPDCLVPMLQSLTLNSSHMIDASTGLLEKNRKMYLGVRYLNTHLRIDNVMIEDGHQSKTVILNIGKPDPSKLISWEYSAKRLESYGDLDLAIWAQKIRNFYESYPRMMGNYFGMIESQDAETKRSLENTRVKINRLKREMESKYPFNRVSILYGREKKELVSVSFNEAMLKEVDQTIESFGVWAREHGIPAMFDGDSKFAEKLGKSYLDFPSSKIEGIEEGKDLVNYLYDMNGSKRKVVTQCIRVREPVPEGMLISIYVLIKCSQPCEEVVESSCDKGKGEEGGCKEGVKCVKECDMYRSN